MQGLASLLIRCAATLVPSDERADWRREWLAEVEAVRSAGGDPLRFALGAPHHALALRAARWQPSLLLADLRYGARWFRRRPLLALTAVATLGLGIGAVTATFGIVYGILLKPLPYRDPSRLVQLWESNPLFNWTQAAIAPGNAVAWRERNQVFDDLAWYQGSASHQSGSADLSLDGDPPAHLRALAVSANFFDVLGAQPARGRTFARGEDEPGRHRVIVLSDALWRDRFGASADVLGTAVRLNGVPFVVIGIMPQGFQFDETPIDLWLPLAARVADLRDIRRPHWMRAIARLKPGVSIAQARQDLSRIAADLAREHPDTNRLMGVGLGPLDEWFVGSVRRPLVTLLAAIGLVLVMACANVANLLLVQTGERSREVAVRVALGASRARLMRQLLTESIVLALTGTALGLVVADGLLRLFLRLAPAGIPRMNEIALHPLVVGFAVGLMILTTLGVGIAPAWQAAHENVRQGLGDGTRTTATGGPRLRRLFVGGEIAIAVVVLVGALMAARSFHALVDVDAGFPVDGLVTAKVALPSRYRQAGQGAAFFESLTTRLQAEPGVVNAGATIQLPLEGSAWTGDLFLAGRPDFHGREIRHKSVTAGYLETLGVPLITGRTIRPTDRPDTPLVVVVNRAFAQQYFPNEAAVGARVSFDDPSPRQKWNTVVGVVGNEPQDSLALPAVPEVYEAEAQNEFTAMSIAIRSDRPVGDVLTLLRRDLKALDPQVALADAGPFADRLGRSLVPERAVTIAMSLFASCALVLAVIGVYGVASGALTRRLREIGIRLAFGATRMDVLRLLVREEFLSVAGGLVVGSALAALAGRLTGAMLYGVTSHDAVSFVGGTAILAVTGALACAVPARRAVRVDPARTLHE